MTSTGRILWCAVVWAGCGMSSAAGEEKMENPEYQNWARFKPGSYVVLEMLNTAMGTTTESTMTQTLKALTPDKAVVETQIVAVIAERSHRMPSQAREIPARLAKAEAEKQTTPEGKVAEGEEELEIAGQRFKAKWVESEVRHGGHLIKTRVWTCQEMPGQVLKMTVSTKGEMATTTESRVVKFKAEKR